MPARSLCPVLFAAAAVSLAATASAAQLSLQFQHTQGPGYSEYMLLPDLTAYAAHGAYYRLSSPAYDYVATNLPADNTSLMPFADTASISSAINGTWNLEFFDAGQLPTSQYFLGMAANLDAGAFATITLIDGAVSRNTRLSWSISPAAAPGAPIDLQLSSGESASLTAPATSWTPLSTPDGTYDFTVTCTRSNLPGIVDLSGGLGDLGYTVSFVDAGTGSVTIGTPVPEPVMMAALMPMGFLMLRPRRHH